jgi:hypothetical protein
MNRESIAQLRAKAGSLYQQARLGGRPCTRLGSRFTRIILGGALLMAIHTALTAKDANLHLKLHHDFRAAQLSVWVDGDLAFSGKVTGSTKKKFGLIPTDSFQASSSQIIPVRSGQHNVGVRIEPDDAAMQENSTSGDFARNTERELLVSARRSSFSLSWQGTGGAPVETSSSFAWISRYAGSLFLTLAGSIMSALAGLRESAPPPTLRRRLSLVPSSNLFLQDHRQLYSCFDTPQPRRYHLRYNVLGTPLDGCNYGA